MLTHNTLLPLHSSDLFDQLQINNFRPVTQFWTAHLQTLLGHFIPSDNFLFPLKQENIILKDQDQLNLLYAQNPNSQTTVIIMHGLGGDAQSDYMRRLANECFQKLSTNIVLVNHRGADKTLHVRKTYHSGRADDASDIIDWARMKFSQTKIIMIGFSMSGSILLNLLSKRFGQSQPDAAIVVNAPLNLLSASKRLRSGFNYIYDTRFYFLLKKILKEKKLVHKKLPLWGTTYLIDELYTSKLNQFKNAHDYYTQCSSLNYLNSISIPTIVLSANDDPFIDAQDYISASWSPSTQVYLTQYGGHMGYIAQKKIAHYQHRWMDYFIAESLKYIESHLFLQK